MADIAQSKPFILAGLGILALLPALFLPPDRLSRNGLFALAIMFGVTVLIALLAPDGHLICYVLGLTPASLIAQHALYLGQIKNPFRSQGRRLDEIDQDFLPNNVENGLSQARRTSERDFGWATLSFRFGVPAVVIALTVGLFAQPLYGTSTPDWLNLSQSFLRGARYRGAGAYVYVLLYLSRRNFRHDITSGAAVWSAVDLILGPILGGVTALLWQAQDPAKTPPMTFSSAVVFFTAGLSPRHVASALEEGARRLIQSPDDKAVLPPTRTKPLTALRGMTAAMVERLDEEGIDDVYAMAMADPLRLMRNTSFDQRQIVSWIDEAILMITLPAQWERLESLGVTGAIDLAWYCDAAIEGARASNPATTSAEIPKEPTDVVKKLAAAVQLDPDILWTTAQRLYWDGQVQIIWVLYQIGAEGVRDVDASSLQGTPSPSPIR